MRIIGVVVLGLGLGACSGGDVECPAGTYPVGDGACAPLDDGSGGTGGGGGGPDGGGGGGGGGGGPTGAQVGDQCEVNEDCASGLFCVFEDYYDAFGICTETCSSWADCSEAFWECCDIGNGGSACIPDDWVDRNPYAVCD